MKTELNRIATIALGLFFATAVGADGVVPGAAAHDGKVHSGAPAEEKAMPAGGKARPAKPRAHREVKVFLAFPMMDPERGMHLFAEKGCVACHAINGVGGHDATPLDAHTMDRVMHPFDFVAKMWRMAPYMIEAQKEALGGQIMFTGEEIADIIAFVHDDEQQHQFTEALITPRIRKMMRHTHGGGPHHQKEIGHVH